MDRKEACEIVDQFGRVPPELREILIETLVNGEARHLESLRMQFAYETETAGFDVLRSMMSSLKRGGKPAREILSQPKPKNVVPIREQIQPWGDGPGAA